jgi:hypothetical protein
MTIIKHSELELSAWNGRLVPEHEPIEPLRTVHFAGGHTLEVRYQGWQDYAKESTAKYGEVTDYVSYDVYLPGGEPLLEEGDFPLEPGTAPQADRVLRDIIAFITGPSELEGGEDYTTWRMIRGKHCAHWGTQPHPREAYPWERPAWIQGGLYRKLGLSYGAQLPPVGDRIVCYEGSLENQYCHQCAHWTICDEYIIDATFVDEQDCLEHPTFCVGCGQKLCD